MTEDALVNLLRTNTPLGRFAAGEVRHVLEYMRSIGFAMASAPDDKVTPTVKLDRTLSPMFAAKVSE